MFKVAMSAPLFLQMSLGFLLVALFGFASDVGK